jgi:endonuclease/exonuclease/phosphatase family metal-dependent hydrolase
MPLRLATFNVKDFFLPRRDSERSIVDRKVVNVAEQLRRASADVVALQEIGSLELLARLQDALGGFGLAYGAPVVGTEDRRGIRNVVLSRLPIQWSQVHTSKSLPFPTFVAGDPDPFPGRIPLRRGVVHVRVEAGALGEVDVLTAHFKSNLPSEQKDAAGNEIADTTPTTHGASAVRSLVQRAAEALYVRSLVDDLFARLPDHAICVMGDFNDTIDSLPVRLLCGIDPMSRRLLRPCADEVAEASRFSCFHGGGRTLIDHVLLSERPRRALRSVVLMNESLRYHGGHVDDPPLTEDSDHALCVVELDC